MNLQAMKPTPKPRAQPGAPASERRSGRDRRIEDLGPPFGRSERRRGIEARKPDVTELDMSNSEWVALTEDLLPKKK